MTSVRPVVALLAFATSLLGLGNDGMRHGSAGRFWGVFPIEAAEAIPAAALSEEAASEEAASKAAGESEAAGEGNSEQLDRRVEGLISQLGSPQYFHRERAQAELERMGGMAFDAIRDAQFSDDIEIALRAKYLVRRLQVRWHDEHDPPEVRRVLRNYGEQPVSERRSRIDRLAALDDQQGLIPLSRLVRFESDLRLSKHAALHILRQNLPESSAARLEWGERLGAAMSLSRSSAAAWVLAYAEELQQPVVKEGSEKLDRTWAGLLEQERETLATFPERTSPEILVDLFRWRAEQLFRNDRRGEAIPLASAALDLIPSKRDHLISAVDWLIQHQVWEGVDQLAEREAEQFSDSVLLRYRLAESKVKRGDLERGEELAEAALKHRGDQHAEHLEAAVGLQERGLFSWAEREFRSIMGNAPIGSNYEFDARFSLAEMLHDQLEDLAAAEVYQEVIDRMQADEAYAKRLRDHRRGDPDIIQARMHFFFAEHYAEHDREKQREHLEQGLQAYPREIDLLIAGYRFADADEAWMTKIRQHLTEAVNMYREQIRQYSETLQRISGHAQENDLRRYVAVLNNQYAWLVANTEGDFDDALRCSRLSLEYVPNSAGYLDTLGRCYYAKGDYKNAVKYQARAVALEPHSGQIRRQMELFEEALEAESR